MRCPSKTGLADFRDHLATFYKFSRGDERLGTMCIEGCETASVQDQNCVAESGNAIVGVGDETTLRGQDRSAFRRADIESVVPAMPHGSTADASYPPAHSSAGDRKAKVRFFAEMRDRANPLVEGAPVHQPPSREATTESEAIASCARFSLRLGDPPLTRAIFSIASLGAALARHSPSPSLRTKRDLVGIPAQPPRRDAFFDIEANLVVRRLRRIALRDRARSGEPEQNERTNRDSEEDNPLSGPFPGRHGREYERI